jgi:hypothetical protein
MKRVKLQEGDIFEVEGIQDTPIFILTERLLR